MGYFNTANVYDTSNATFTIASAATIGTVQIISPNGGETLTAGTTTTISYSNTGNITSLELQYTTDNGANWYQAGIPSISASSYSWTIPSSINSSLCKVKILGYFNGANVYDTSNSTFTIAIATTISQIQWSGYTWNVRPAGTGNPGSNNWSNTTDNVWVDNDGNLHLKITKVGDKWYCSEIYSQESFGYGEYTFQTLTNVENLDKNIVLGLFTYETDTKEVDIEFSKWGNINNKEGNFVVQPSSSNSTINYPLNLTGCLSDCYSTHKFQWSPSSIYFQSYYGHYSNLPSSDNLIKNWTYTGANIPTNGNEKVHLNFWLFNGNPPSNLQDAEVIIKSFSFKKEYPLGSYIDFQPILLSKFVTINDNITFKGTLRDVNGNCIPNFKIKIDDGLGLICLDGVITNQNGEFSYPTIAKQSGLAEILFYLPNGEKQGIYINVTVFSTEFSTTIAGVKQINILNDSKKDWCANIIVDNIEKDIILKSGEKTTALASESIRNHFPLSITTSASLKLTGINLGIVGISVSENNEGTIKTSASAGEALYRGEIYYTSKGDYGGCWAPGGDLSVIAKIEGAICLGTDGISIGGGLSFLNIGGSISIKLYEFTSGITNANFNSNIKIYPNPTTDKFEISEIESLGNECKVEIINNLGSLIYVSVYKNFGNKISLDLSPYPVGMYMIKLSNNEVSYQKKVIKK